VASGVSLVTVPSILSCRVQVQITYVRTGISIMFQSGDRISLKDARFGVVKELVVENLGGKFLFAALTNPYDRLFVHIKARKHDSDFLPTPPERIEFEVSFQPGTPKRNNTFTVVEQFDGTCQFQTFVSGFNLNVPVAIGVNSTGEWTPAMPLKTSGDESLNFFVVATKSTGFTRDVTVMPYVFQKWELRRLVLEGFLRITNVIDPEAVSNCLALLNGALGIPGRVTAGGVQEQGFGKLAGDFSNSSIVRSLLRGRSLGILTSLLGAHGFDATNISAQIAFRFPERGLNGPKSVLDKTIR
jgi:hypothetical protein